MERAILEYAIGILLASTVGLYTWVLRMSSRVSVLESVLSGISHQLNTIAADIKTFRSESHAELTAIRSEAADRQVGMRDDLDMHRRELESKIRQGYSDRDNGA